MSISLQQLIDQAISIANRGVDQSAAPALSAEMVAEDLLSTVFQQVGQTVAKDPARRSLLRRSVDVAFTNGSATLTDAVLTEYLSESTLYDSTDLTKQYSWVSQFENFIRKSDRRIGFYSVNESSINIVEPSAVYAVASGLTGSRKLVIPCTPEVPATATTTVDVRAELIDDLVMGLADELRNPLYKGIQFQTPRVRIQ